MTTTLTEQLQPGVVDARVRSEYKTRNTIMQDLMGLGLDTEKKRSQPERYGVYDVINPTRDVPDATQPDKSATKVAKQVLGQVGYSIPRTFYSMDLSADQLLNVRSPGNNGANGVDINMGYMARQEFIQKQRMTNLREFQIAGMLRGSYGYTRNGDGLKHVFTGGTYTIDYQLPAANKNQLGGILGVVWSDASSPMLGDFEAIHQSFYEDYGEGLTDVIVHPTIWGYIRGNTEIKGAAGTANSPFEYLERDPKHKYWKATLKALPGVTIHIVGYNLSVGGSTVAAVPTDGAFFLSLGDPDQCDIAECGEMVSERYDVIPHLEYGEYFYMSHEINPTRYGLYAIGNSIPRLFHPLSVKYGTVTGF